MDIEASSELTLEDDAFEDSTTHELRDGESALCLLPVDVWAIVVLHLSVWDTAACVSVLCPQSHCAINSARQKNQKNDFFVAGLCLLPLISLSLFS